MKGLRLIVLALLAASSLVSNLPTAAATAGGLDLPIVDFFVTTIDLPVTIVPNASDPAATLKVGSPIGQTKQVDAVAGTVLGSETFVPVFGDAPPDGLTTASGQNFNCVKDEDPLGFTAYQPQYSSQDTRDWSVSWIMALYSQRAARVVVGMGSTFQVEECAVGGSDTKNGFRQTKAGASIAFSSNTPAYLGYKWATGDSTARANASLSFQSLMTPVQITGSVDITPANGRNAGRLGPGPVKTKLDAFSQNEASGWWESGCENVVSCGSPDWEGSVVHGLWEFPESLDHPLTFSMGPYIKYHCGTWLNGCR